MKYTNCFQNYSKGEVGERMKNIAGELMNITVSNVLREIECYLKKYVYFHLCRK